VVTAGGREGKGDQARATLRPLRTSSMLSRIAGPGSASDRTDWAKGWNDTGPS
jgi:hypothetical protein